MTITTTSRWANYQNDALSTAIYPDQGNNLAYPALGLCGEAAELAQAIRHPDSREQLIGELGDVTWYIAVLTYEAGIDPARLDQHTDHDDLRDPADRVVAAAGQIAETVKKALRDNGGIIDTSRRDKIEGHLCALIAAVADAAGDIELTLDDILAANTAKLASRQQRGTLSGSGDFR